MNHQINLIAESPAFLILSADIKTVPVCTYSALSGNMKRLWQDFITKRVPREEAPQNESDYERLWNDKSPLHAEFGKVGAIGINFFKFENGVGGHNARLFTGGEFEVLQGFGKFLSETSAKLKMPVYLCGHNCTDFDIPFLCRRYVLNGLPIPYMLDSTTRKGKWDKGNIIDTMELWGFDQWKYFTPLTLLCEVTGAGAMSFPENTDGDGPAEERGAIEDSYNTLMLMLKWMGKGKAEVKPLTEIWANVRK